MELFPSEIARLVLGYLKEECSELATIFEAKSLNLIEYRLLALQNKNPRTTVNSMTLINILNQHNAVVNYIHNKLKELTQSQTISNSSDLIENLETIFKTVGEKNSDRDEVSVVYERITHSQNSTENVKNCVKLDFNEDQKPNMSVKKEKIKSEKLIEEQENKLDKIFQKHNYINYKERRELADQFGVSEMLIKSWFQKRRDEINTRSRRRYRRDSTDSDDTLYEPRPSTSHAANENDMNCSSSSRYKKHKSPKKKNRNSDD